MPQIHHETQRAMTAQHFWAMYSLSGKRAMPAPWSSHSSPADAEIMQMAEWYSECEFGTLAVESDALDHNHN